MQGIEVRSLGLPYFCSATVLVIQNNNIWLRIKIWKVSYFAFHRFLTVQAAIRNIKRIRRHCSSGRIFTHSSSMMTFPVQFLLLESLYLLWPFDKSLCLFFFPVTDWGARRVKNMLWTWSWTSQYFARPPAIRPPRTTTCRHAQSSFPPPPTSPFSRKASVPSPPHVSPMFVVMQLIFE